MASHIDSELVLRNQTWLRELAMGLLGDTHRAQDVVQDAWLAAVEKPPRCLASGRGLPTWLSRVVHNLAPAEAQPATADVVERRALRIELLEAVDGLEPRYREVLVMRYFEGLSTAEIARRSGRPC